MKIKQVNQVKRINEILVNRGYQNSDLADILPIPFVSFLIFACYVYNKSERKIIYLKANGSYFFEVKGLGGKVMLDRENQSLSYHTHFGYLDNIYILIYPSYFNPCEIYINYNSFKVLVTL